MENHGINKIHVMEKDAVAEGSTLSFHNINYVVQMKKFPWSKSQKKIVLENMR